MTRLELDSHSTVSVKAARLDLTSLMAQAQQLVDEGKCEAAEALYESWLALGTDPLAHIAWFNLGAIRQRSRKFNDAVKAYEQALSLVPQLVVATINLGLCFESLGRNRCTVDLGANRRWPGSRSKDGTLSLSYGGKPQRTCTRGT